MSATRLATPHDALNRLLMRVAQNDREAFAELYRHTSPRLLGVCARMVADRREAEEVLQEAYVTIWQRARTFDPSRANAMAWLVAVARNKSIDRLRQRRDAVAADHTPEIEGIADDEPTPAVRAERGQEYRRLQQCLDQLESQQRRSIQEAFFSGLTYNALAQRAKVPIGTMKSWIRRGLLQLRACLDA